MQHGGDLTDIRARHGGAGDAWLDLSTGINPHAWPVPADLGAAAWRRLPAAEDLAGLVAAARLAYRVPAAAGVVAAPGTQALIQWLPRLAAPGGVAVLGPTYAEHAASWRLAGRAVTEIEGVGALPDAARHAVVVNPNNPDGRVLGHDALAALARAVERRGGWLVVDESFADVDPALSVSALVTGLPVIVLRSFGKFYGLAGLRLGFAVAAEAIARPIAAAVGPWAVSGPAIAVARAALADAGWAEAMRARLVAEARALDRVLAAGGLEPSGGCPLYRLARHPRAGLIHERLASARIWTRRFDWASDLLRFGLPGSDPALGRLAAGLRAATDGSR